MAKTAAQNTEEPAEQSPARSGFFQSRLNSREVATFCRQLAVLMDAGIPMVRSLKILGRRGGASGMRELLQNVTVDVEAGGAFSTALQAHGKSLPGIVVPLCRAGEKGGELSKNLRYLADSLDHDAHVRGKIANAMIFPVITLTLAIGLIIFLLKVIAPKFLGLIIDMESNLARPSDGTAGKALEPNEVIAQMDSSISQMVFKASQLLESRTNEVILLIVIAAVTFGLWRAVTNRSYLMDFIKIRTPFLGRMVTTAAMARFGKTLGALLRTGVPVLESLRLARDTVDNMAIEQAVVAMEKSVENGGRMSAPLEEYWYIPELARDMILIGEESGSMAEMLDNLAEVCRALVDRDQDRLVAVIEPVMTLILGGVVLFVMLAMFLPYIQLVTKSFN